MPRSIATPERLGKVRVIKGVTVQQASPENTGTLWSSDNPYVIWPHYIGRDKGAIRSQEGVLVFFSEGRAWKWIFDHVQPDDPRACDNYTVVRLGEYLGGI